MHYGHPYSMQPLFPDEHMQGKKCFTPLNCTGPHSEEVPPPPNLNCQPCKIELIPAEDNMFLCLFISQKHYQSLQI